MSAVSNGPAEDPQITAAAVTLPRIQAGQRLEVRNADHGAVLVHRLQLALNPWLRFKGLLGTAGLRPGQGLLLRPCRGVHTLFMGYPIDVLFLNAGGRIVELRASLPPWRATPMVGEALAVLELPAGQAAATRTARGDRVIFVPGEPTP